MLGAELHAIGKQYGRESLSSAGRRADPVKKSRRNKIIWAYCLIAPSLVLIIVLNLWPILQTIFFSLNKIHGFEEPRFVGLSNYFMLLQDKIFWKSLWNTVLYTVVTVPVIVALSLLTAVALNQKIHWKGFFRVCYFLPVISAPTAVAMVWRWIYNDQFGILNYLLSVFHIPSVNWIGDRNVVLWSIMFVGIWSLVGYNMVILLGGLQNISPDYYEAARIDGADGVKSFFHITLPLVTPTLFFVVMTTIISSLQTFDYVFMMVDDNSPVLNSTETIVYYFYKQTFVQYNKGYGSAIAIMLLIFILILTFVQMKCQEKWVIYN